MCTLKKGLGGLMCVFVTSTVRLAQFYTQNTQQQKISGIFKLIDFFNFFFSLFKMQRKFRIRGQLSTIFMNARNIGVLIAFTLGSYFDYITSSIFFTAITIIFLVAIWFVPSTPQYFLRKNEIGEAQKAFNFYNQHRLQTDPKYCVVQFENLKGVAKEVECDSKLAWKDISNYFFVFFLSFSFGHEINIFWLISFQLNLGMDFGKRLFFHYSID